MRRLVAILGCALVFVLAGCTGVPTTGPVVRHEQQQAQREGGVQIAPDPPAPGASPQLIVEGFLHAMATYQIGHPVAKQYLTAAAAASWQPDSGVQVYTQGSPRAEADGRVYLRSRLVGAMDGRGEYRQRDEALEHDFGLVRETGEWRVSKPPAGLLIADFLFRNTYRKLNLYYLDRSDDRVIPDQVFVPRGSPDLARITRTLLAGPSGWLSPVVRPVPTDVTVTSVREEHGTVQVEVSRAALDLSEAARTLLFAQLAWTLGQFEPVTGVRVVAGNEPLWIEEADSNSVVKVSAMARFAPISDVVSRQLFGVHESGIVRVTEDESGPGVSAGWVFPRRITGFAADGQALQGAVVLAGAELLTGPLGGQPKSVRQGTGLARPQFVRSELWSLTSAAGGAPRVWANDREQAVLAPALAGEQVQAFRLSPDGTRMAVVSGTGGGRLGMVRVKRSEGRITLEGWTPLRVGTGLVPVDVGWLDDSTLAVAFDLDGRVGVATTDIAGAVIDDLHMVDLRVPATMATSARPFAREAALLVCDAAGACYRYTTDLRWTPLRTALHAPSYPS